MKKNDKCIVAPINHDSDEAKSNMLGVSNVSFERKLIQNRRRCGKSSSSENIFFKVRPAITIIDRYNGDALEEDEISKTGGDCGKRFSSFYFGKTIGK